MPLLMVLLWLSALSAYGGTCLDELRALGQVPAIVDSWRGKRTGYEGANCYQAALLPHLPGLAGRHVNGDELRYYLTRDFDRVAQQKMPATADGLVSGDILVFDSFEHAAFHLGRGLLFDRPAWQSQYAYRTVPLSEAHTGMLPEVGGDPHDRLIGKVAQPFREMATYRPKPAANAGKKETLEGPAVEWQAFLNLANRTLQARFEPGDQKHVLLSLFTEEILRAAQTHLRKAVEPSWEEAPAFATTPTFRESYFELGSRLDGYQGFVTQYHFSSVYMTYDKFHQQNAAALKVSESRAEDTALITAYLRARQQPSDPAAVKTLIEKAQAAYPRPFLTRDTTTRPSPNS